MSEWQSIETAPGVGVPILLLINGQAIEGARVSRKYAHQSEWEPIWLDSHGCGCCGSSDPEPSHWAPLPTLPRSGRGG